MKWCAYSAEPLSALSSASASERSRSDTVAEVRRSSRLNSIY